MQGYVSRVTSVPKSTIQSVCMTHRIFMPVELLKGVCQSCVLGCCPSIT